MKVILPPLPYAIDALEPHISRRTLAAHHGHHHSAYVAKTRALIQGTALEREDLEKILAAAPARSRALYNASGQAWNHAFYWASMRPGGGGPADGPVAALIEGSFGSQSRFNEQFISAASDLFGSGWIWLTLDGDTLRLVTTSNADSPLTENLVPLLTLDLWEHAYYLDYEHRRLDYIAAFLGHLADWKIANRRLAAASSSSKSTSAEAERSFAGSRAERV